MRKTIFIFIAMAFAYAAIAQTAKPKPVVKPIVKAVAKPVAKIQVPPPVKVLKTLNDSLNYAIGVSVINFYKNQGITKFDSKIISLAINDFLAGKPFIIDDAAANQCINTSITKANEGKSKAVIMEGEKFLAENKKKPNIKTTISGLQYEVIAQGTGAKPNANSKVTAHYRGSLINGTIFDESYKRGQPFEFSINQVIKGWTEGIQLMNEGGKYKFYIPYTLAYGTNTQGAIPGGSMLIFEVELIKVENQEAK